MNFLGCEAMLEQYRQIDCEAKESPHLDPYPLGVGMGDGALARKFGQFQHLVYLGSKVFLFHDLPLLPSRKKLLLQ